jgi:hypothetical protein
MGNEDPTSVAVRCACGLQFTLEQWSKLDLAGVQDDEDGVMLEMRNCPCGSTRARTVDFRAAVRLLNDETKRLRRALARLRDIDRAVAGLSQEIGEIDRGIVRTMIDGAGENERKRASRIIRETLSSLHLPHPAETRGEWLKTLGEILEARIEQR